LTKSEEKKDSSNENPLPTGSNNRAIYLGIGLLFVVIAVVFIKRRKQADDLNTALVEGRHDISAF
jgi:LPXTG-motif cell wall-anchored protein